jgi:hypothetical protein
MNPESADRTRGARQWFVPRDGAGEAAVARGAAALELSTELNTSNTVQNT